jgi:HAD superfamily hydrolase (TIGR01490 family)
MESARLPADPPSGIALFDLDGTLIPWDCQLLFRHHVVRREPWRLVFLPVFLAFLPCIKILGDEGMKRVFLSYLWRMDRKTLARHARDFGRRVAASIYPELRARIEAHRRQGHLLILASASPDWYVREIGAALGFDLSLGTPVEPTPTCRFFPDLENHKGAAKVGRLQQLLPASYFTDGRLRDSHGYTDSTADLPMLAICDQSTVVNPGGTLARLATQHGWNLLRPTRPWTHRAGFAWRALALLTGCGGNPGALKRAPDESPTAPF